MDFWIGLLLGSLSLAGLVFVALLVLKGEVWGEFSLCLWPGEISYTRLWALALFVSWLSSRVVVTVKAEALSQEETALLDYFVERYGWTVAAPQADQHCSFHPNMLQ
jgi:hypothetical protein